MIVLGVDIGGTKCGVLLAAYKNGKITFLNKRTFPTEHNKGPDFMICKLVEQSRVIIKEQKLQSSDIAGAGINCGGPLDSQKGIILCPPNLPGWVNIPIVALLEKELEIQCFLQNDANAGAVAEHLFGAGRDSNNMMFLTFGTGMGAGLILNGELYSGTNDMAGEVGHIRLDANGPVGFGKSGSFEGFCSGGGIAQLAKTKALEKLQMGISTGYCQALDKLDGITAQTVAEAAYAGDETAKEVFALCGQYLGKALSLFIDILNPEVIALGSIYRKCQDLLDPYMHEVINKETLAFARGVCKIVPCELGDNINDYEAAAIAIYELSI